MNESQEALVAKVVESLENGVAPWVRPWQTTGITDMPHNLATKKRYRGANVLQLWMSAQALGYPTNEWATFVQAKEELGGMVRKGEHGTKIWFIQPTKYVKQNAQGEDEERQGVIWKEYTVFNRAQIDGLPDVATVDAQPFDAIAHVSEYVAAIGADIRHGGDQAYFSPDKDFIQMPQPERFCDAGNYYATLLHEHTHWTGRSDRLARVFGKRFGDDAYAFEELVAELGAAFNCAQLGIAGTLRHTEYLANWAKVLKNDPKALWTAGSKASQAVDYLDTRAGALEAIAQDAIAA